MYNNLSDNTISADRFLRNWVKVMLFVIFLQITKLVLLIVFVIKSMLRSYSL